MLSTSRNDRIKEFGKLSRKKSLKGFSRRALIFKTRY